MGIQKQISAALLAFALLLAPAAAAELKVLRIDDGDTIILSNNQTVRLYGIKAPRLHPTKAEPKPQPLALEAKSFLTQLAADKPVTLSRTDKHDRHERLLAEVFLADGTSLQAAMLQAGMAQLYPMPDNTEIVSKLAAAEVEARQARRGMWAHPFFAVQPANDNLPVGRYSVVVGTVMAAAKVRDKIYLNFGTNHKQDFTIMLPSSLGKAVPWQSLTGQKILMRGWVEPRGGPMITISNPYQLEMINE